MGSKESLGFIKNLRDFEEFKRILRNFNVSEGI